MIRVNISEMVRRKPWVGWALFLATILVVFLVGLFGATIIERRTEGVVASVPVRALPEFEPRNAVWGQQFPRQFQTYIQTLDTTFASRWGGSRHRDMLAQHPEMVVLWAGYAFARDYDQIRGHYYSVKDVHLSLRTNIDQPGTCWTCKSTDVPRLMAEHGVAGFYSMRWRELGPEVTNPIGCQDCHDPATMQLRITRPALIEALERIGTPVERATHQEMRSLVCAQCHVEYYFRPGDNYLIFPWDENGVNADAQEAFLDRVGHTDWVHALSRAPMIKVQHPDWELFQQGIHAYRGVSCADCHMPYRREGGVKFTNHHIQSPLADVASSCMVCHGGTEQEMIARVYDTQDKVYELRHRAERQLAMLHIEAHAAWNAGATEDEMAPILRAIRSSQWRWDWTAASHGAAFHAPVEAMRLLGESLSLSGHARLELARTLGRLDVPQPVPMPEWNKESLQAFIGLDMNAQRAQKAAFLRDTLPVWEAHAAQRQPGPTDYVPSAVPRNGARGGQP
jgi:nitrite reductase (cytochrome c-552)